MTVSVTSTYSYNKDPDKPERLADDLLFEAHAIARELGITPRSAYYFLANGQLPGRKLGATWVGSKSELKKALVGDGLTSAGGRAGPPG